METSCIAVVEDDREIRALVVDLLHREGFEAVGCRTTAEFDQLNERRRVDLAVLDVMLPGEDGFSLCRRLHAAGDIPVLMVTAKSDDVDRIVGLELGADDYLAKPFNSRELLARVRSIIRRTRDIAAIPAGGIGENFQFNGWLLRVAPRDLLDPTGNPVTLTTGEFDLLNALVQNAQRILSREFLIDWTRGGLAAPTDRVIDVQIGRLRRKLGDDPREPALIRTVRGDGYLFAPSVTRC